MMNVTRSSVFPATREEVFARLQRLETLQRVAWPYATFEPVGEDAGVWERGETSSYRFRLLGGLGGLRLSGVFRQRREHGQQGEQRQQARQGALGAYLFQFGHSSNPPYRFQRTDLS